MKTTITAIVATLCIIASTSTSSARGPYGSINVGNWKGGAYTDDQTGAFTHCAAGTQIRLGHDRRTVAVRAEPAWRENQMVADGIVPLVKLRVGWI